MKYSIYFKLRNNLIYYTVDNRKEKLYIPYSLKGEVFYLAYNLSNYSGFYRVYDRLANSVYIVQLAKRLRAYIAYYLEYQLFQTKRYTLYNLLYLIATSAILFYTIVINFVVELLEVRIDKFNILLIITNKFTKKVLSILGKDIQNATNQANVVIVTLLSYNQGISKAIISD